MGFELGKKTNCGGVGEPPCPDPKKASGTRGGNTTYVSGKVGSYTFHKKPQYKGQRHSTHLMADDNVSKAWPSISRDSVSGKWSNQSQQQASNRNEVYKFKSTDKLINFARKGNWKIKNQ
jgi:GH35 family endo-1,4-beta-xylanase